MRRLQAGESFTLTRNGTIVGTLVPASRPAPLAITRVAVQAGFEGFPLYAACEKPVSSVLAELREDRL
jgi:antitoxin (DNA-binding transcriptional repressor) of toxin-antitoxin stability system